MITLEERGRDRFFFESVQFRGEQGDATDKQYIFPRQCLVLGDSEVGKTSLVKSLTGKPFDPKQQKTQGIDQCLVDNEWKNCNMKDLVFGDLWKFLGIGQVELLLRTSTSGTATFCQVMSIFSKPMRVFFDFGYLTLFPDIVVSNKCHPRSFVRFALFRHKYARSRVVTICAKGAPRQH